MGYARVELRLGVVGTLCTRTCRSRPVVDASASAAAATGRGIGSGLEQGGVGKVCRRSNGG